MSSKQLDFLKQIEPTTTQTASNKPSSNLIISTSASLPVKYSSFIQPLNKETRGRKRKIPVNNFGGHYHKNYNPSQKRPLYSNKALHVVLRSNFARGLRSFKNHKYESRIWNTIEKHASKNNIKIYSYANAGNHLHLLVRVKNRNDYNCFIRTITGLIARIVMSTQRGKAKKQIQTKKTQTFWDGRPFTRVVHFGNDFNKVKSYLLRNILETIGWTKKLNRSKKLTKEWKDFWYQTCEVPI